MASPSDALFGPATPEILAFIFSIAMKDSYRPLSTVVRFSLVCRYWKRVVDLSVVWRRGLWISPSEAAPIDTVIIPRLLEPHAVHIRHLSFEGYPLPIPILHVLEVLPQLLTLTAPFHAEQFLSIDRSSPSNSTQQFRFASSESRFMAPLQSGRGLSFAPASHILQSLELRCPSDKQDPELVVPGLLSLLVHIPYLLELSLSADLVREVRDLPLTLLSGVTSRCECLKVLRVDSDLVLASLREAQQHLTDPIGRQLNLHLSGTALLPVAPLLWRSARHHLINSDGTEDEDEDEDEDEWEAVRPSYRMATPYPRFLRSQVQRQFRYLFEASFYNQYDIFCGRPLVYPILLPPSDPRAIAMLESLLGHGALPHFPLYADPSTLSGPSQLSLEQLHPELGSLFNNESNRDIPWNNIPGMSAVGLAILFRRWHLLPLLLKRWCELGIASVLLEKQISLAVQRILENKHLPSKRTVLDLFAALLARPGVLPVDLDLVKLVLISVKNSSALDQPLLEKLTLQLLDLILRSGVRVRALSAESQASSSQSELILSPFSGATGIQSHSISEWPTSPGTRIPFASFEGLPHVFYTDHFKVWEFLVSKGCDINAVDSPVSNRTLLHHKIYENCLPAVYWLLNNQGLIHSAFDPIRVVLDSIRPGDLKSEEFAATALKMFIMEGLLPRDKIPLTQVLSIKSLTIFQLLLEKDWIELPRPIANRRLLSQASQAGSLVAGSPRSSPVAFVGTGSDRITAAKERYPKISPHLLVLLVSCFNASAEFMVTLWDELCLSAGYLTSNGIQDYSSSSDEEESKPGIDYGAAPGGLQIPDGSTALHVACQVCWRKYVFRFLILHKKLGMHQRNTRGETPFLAACKAANVVAVRWLIYYRYKLNIKENDQALLADPDFDQEQGSLEPTRSDMPNGAADNFKLYLPSAVKSPRTPSSAEPLPPPLPNSKEALRAKLTLFSEKDVNGNSGLHLAVDALSYSLVEFLCSNEFPVTATNDKGQTPLDMCKTEFDDNAHWDKNMAMFNLLAAFHKLQTGKEPQVLNDDRRCILS